MSKVFKLGVVGNPIEHSLSPFIHSRFSRQTNINIEYLPFKVSNEDFSGFVEDFFKDNSAKGLNITLPHKKEASLLEGTISKEANFINAVNTIVRDNKRIFLYSTDGEGFLDDIRNKGFNVKDKRVLISGAGAAAESILYKVAQSRTKNITLFNRTEEKAIELSKKYGHFACIDTIVSKSKKYDLIINSSSAGLTGEFKPIQNAKLSKNTIFYDLNYSLADTPFCKWAKAHSNHVHDGVGMLVFQAAHSYKMWFGILPDTESVLKDIKEMKE